MGGVTEARASKEETAKNSTTEGAIAVQRSTAFYTAAADDIIGKRACHGSRELLGYSCGPARDDPDFWVTRIHPADRLRVIREMSAIAKKGSISAEYRLLCANGSYKWVLDGAVLLRDGSGAPLEIVGAIHDITDRKVLDEGIWEHEEFLETLLESASMGLFVLDKRSNLVYLTAALQRSLGLKTGDWVHGDSRMSIHQDDLKGAMACFRKALRGRACRCNARVRSANGTCRKLVIDLSPVRWRGQHFVLGVINKAISGSKSPDRGTNDRRSVS
jgi:PAS domain S-box-containing protein